jgi:CubicO group peptidase (beta-lactamase class C family)
MIRILTALLFTTLVYTVAAQPISSPGKEPNDAPKKALNRYFSQLAQNGQLNGTVLVAGHGEISYEHSFGYADFAAKRLNLPTALFPIASITKSITATAILQLRDKGRLDVEDPVVKHLTNFPYPSVTIRHLLSHTAGLPIYDSLFFSVIDQYPDTVFTNADIIPACLKTKQPLKFQPGSDFSYNNVNYNVLALLIEAVSGLPYETYLKEYLFKPAGMMSTFSAKMFTWQDKPVSQFYRLRYPYSSQYERADTVAEFKRMYNFKCQGHGDLVSTARDLLHFDIALHQGKLVSKAALHAMFTPVKLSDGRDNPQRYGLGWITGNDASNEPVVFHDGAFREGAQS